MNQSSVGQNRFSLWQLLLAVTVVAMLLGVAMWFLYWVNEARSAAANAVLQGHQKQTVLALHNYHDLHGVMPPAGDASKSPPEMSWRVAITPYMESQAFFNAYRQDLPWNAAANDGLCRQFASRHLFTHPSAKNRDDACTNIVAVTGPGTLWPDSGPRKLEDVSDGLRQTIILVEIARSDIAWHEPRDIDIDEVSFVPGPGKRVIGGHARGGAYVVFADGQVKWLPDTITPQTLRALLTIDGGEDVDVSSINP